MPHTLKLIDGAEIIGVEVSTGNPHFVILVDNPDFTVGQRAWAAIGAEICTHRDFPHQTNVEFVRIVSDREIEIRIFERGVGPTSSSGTGSSAVRHGGARFAPLHLAAHSRRSRRRANCRLGWPRRRSCISPGPPRSSPAERLGEHDETSQTTAPSLPARPSAIVAPASSAQPERIDRGLAALQLSGYAPHLGRQRSAARAALLCRNSCSSASPICTPPSPTRTRAPSCALRGGYGSNYLLDGLDLEIIAAHPKPFFAYSDLTGIQLRLLDELGLPAFHGPMLAADFYLQTASIWKVFAPLSRASPTASAPPKASASSKPAARTTGRHAARSMAAASASSFRCSARRGSRRTEGKLLFLEDIGVKPYQIDRMLWQLRKAGKLDGVLGIVFGEMLDCVSPGARA